LLRVPPFISAYWRLGPSISLVAVSTLITIFVGTIYVGGAWTPSHYGKVLERIGAPQKGPAIGSARDVRSDEWAVLTPYFQIAVASGLGEQNATSPYHEPLRTFYALPTKDWTIIFKPQLWGFLIFPPEYAYSLYHFVLAASLIWGFALLFRQFGIAVHWAVIGALLIFFSRFVQVWWTSIAPTFAFAPWPLLAALVPGAPVRRFVLVFYAAAVWLLSLLYAPFIIAGAFALLGMLIAFRPDALRAAILLPAALGALAANGVVYYYYQDLFTVMLSTLYPGSRVSGGGNVRSLHLLAHIFPYIATKQFEPVIRDMNECEISTVSSYLPLLVAVFADWRLLIQRIRAFRWTGGVLILCICLMLSWLVLPLPAEMGWIFLWNWVPPWRLLWAFGLLSTCMWIWLASLAEWRITAPRIAIFVLITGGVWLGSKMDVLLENWFDGVILGAVAVCIACTAISAWMRVSTQRHGIALAGSAILTSAVTFGTFNPLQSASPIFHLAPTPMLESMKRLAAGHPNGWLALPGSYGAVLAGLGLPSINHALLQPQLGFFRSLFPDLPPDNFNTTFNRYMHVDLGPVSGPQVGGVIPLDSFYPQEDHVLIPITRVGTPLEVNTLTEEPTNQPERSGQIESIRLEVGAASWRIWLQGWAPFEDIAPGQSLELWMPEEIAQQQKSVRAVRSIRPELTADAAGRDFRIGGFILEFEGAGDPPPRVFSRNWMRVFSRNSGTILELVPAPTVQVRMIQEKNALAALAHNGSVEAIELREYGHALAVHGWLSSPVTEPIDEVVFYLDLPTVGAELSWTNRTDVARAMGANHLLSGFTLHIRLLKPLQAVPPATTLCVAALVGGRLLARARDHERFQCR
jgi:hypothetical protein